MFALAEKSATPAASLTYILVGIVVGLGAIAYFFGKWQSGRKDGKKEDQLAADSTVDKTIKNLQDLVNSQTMRLNDQDDLISKASVKAEQLKEKVEVLEHEIKIIKTIPLVEISNTLKNLEAHMVKQDKMWSEHFVSSAAVANAELPA